MTTKRACDLRRYRLRLQSGRCPRCGGMRDLPGVLCSRDLARLRESNRRLKESLR